MAEEDRFRVSVFAIAMGDCGQRSSCPHAIYLKAADGVADGKSLAVIRQARASASGLLAYLFSDMVEVSYI